MAPPTYDELNLLHANICKSLGDPKRIQILYALHHEARHVTALAEDLDTPQPTVSRHLAVLRTSGLVNAERDGALVVYSLVDPEIIEVLNAMRGVLHRNLTRQSELIN